MKFNVLFKNTFFKYWKKNKNSIKILSGIRTHYWQIRSVRSTHCTTFWGDNYEKENIYKIAR